MICAVYGASLESCVLFTTACNSCLVGVALAHGIAAIKFEFFLKSDRALHDEAALWLRVASIVSGQRLASARGRSGQAMVARSKADPGTLVHYTKCRASRVAAAAILALAGPLATCAPPPPPPVAGSRASDPSAAAPAATYRSVIGSYTSRRPVDPTPWRDQNEGAALAPGIAPLPKP